MKVYIWSILSVEYIVWPQEGKRVLDVNSVFGIKNTKFIIGFKKMTKLVRLATLDVKWALAVVVNESFFGQWPSFTTPAIENNKLPMTGVVNDDH